MATVFDVAKYVLQKTGSLSTMKLQKLVYYAQAWSTVWDDPPDSPLFEEPIQAWAFGPVVPVLYEAHRGHYAVNAEFLRQGDVSRLTTTQTGTIDAVLEFYGGRSAQWLSNLAHSEAPWILARKGIPEGERGNADITLESMSEYYGNL